MAVRTDDVTFFDLFKKLRAVTLLHKVSDVGDLQARVEMVEVHDVRREAFFTVFAGNLLDLVDEIPESLLKAFVASLLAARVGMTMLFLDFHHARLAP